MSKISNMKNFINYSLFLFFSVAMLIGCAKRTVPIENYVTPIVTSKSAQGVIYLSASGYARTKEAATQAALRFALDEIIFRGLANSSVKRPLINEPGAREKHDLYFKRFFADGGPYANYGKIMRVDPLKTVRFKNGYQVYADIEINYDALQRDLQSAGIIGKFGI
jgi:hypothetical protein